MFEIISKLFTLTTIVTNQCFLGWGREEVEEGGKGGEGGEGEEGGEGGEGWEGAEGEGGEGGKEDMRWRGI